MCQWKEFLINNWRSTAKHLNFSIFSNSKVHMLSWCHLCRCNLLKLFLDILSDLRILKLPIQGGTLVNLLSEASSVLSVGHNDWILSGSWYKKGLITRSRHSLTWVSPLDCRAHTPVLLAWDIWSETDPPLPELLLLLPIITSGATPPTSGY